MLEVIPRLCFEYAHIIGIGIVFIRKIFFTVYKHGFVAEITI